MKILLTQRKLHHYAGTELVTLELALALKARGHEVAVYCPRIGVLNNVLLSNGIKAYDDTADIPLRPDVIHAHHQLPALAALARFDQVPCVYVCHGQRPWVEHPPRHPQMRTYAAVSRKLATHIATKFDLPAGQVRVVPNFVDTDRFSRVRQPGAGAPSRAVLFGQSGFSVDEIEALDHACAQNGITLDKVGYAYGNVRHNPELFLPDYDIAFAIGRSALEAMACGCATIPIVPSLAGSMVTSETLQPWADTNFSPRYFSGADQVNEAWLAGQLEAYDPQDVAEVTKRVREDHAMSRVVGTLEALYREAAAAAPVTGAAEALARELNRIAREVDEIWDAPPAQNTEPSYAAALENQSATLSDMARSFKTLTSHLIGREKRGREGGSGEMLLKTIEASGLFQRDWYLDQNPDVARAGIDPLRHYLSFGAMEERDPAAFFDGKGYMAANPHLNGVALAPIEIVVREAVRSARWSDKVWWRCPDRVRKILRRFGVFVAGMKRRSN
ncbi:glycosyltransferase family 4 protein [Breoghania sp. L-A4]|uniref:glycosyltransferase family 4 protein n=1 Tax=Breoghania sp. L-A4 TaxID=2304600 RepID=UPI000E359D1A|nr:glycosyltransferase family 4 protein [Breoghania sp. L-A4]AXS40277.1 hypothetical protein D1F64_09670 [Breoghania sp. L-A4]